MTGKNGGGAKRESIALGLGLLLLAALLAWQTTLIPAGGTYAQVGPTAAPWLATALLALLGLAFIAVDLLGRNARPAQADAPDARASCWITGALLLNLALIESAGFIIASTILFTLTARAFGSARPARDAALGVLLALVGYLAFDHLLGYRIGSGLIEQYL